eukprot:2777625-Prymnesium_polylepis.2
MEWRKAVGWSRPWEGLPSREPWSCVKAPPSARSAPDRHLPRSRRSARQPEASRVGQCVGPARAVLHFPE